MTSWSYSEARAAAAEELAALSELRALQRRFELNQLEASDWPKLKELVGKYIDEAEAAGLEEVVLELPDRDPRR